MKTIGFADYYLGEWHANNYPKWIEEASAKLGLDYKVAYAWAEEDVSPVNGVTTNEWCREYGVRHCDTLKELCEKCDHVILLAPSDPDKHLGYAKEVLKHGKRTYIDKTFAPDLKTAEKIFALAEKYNTEFFSTSALRYASELKEFTNVKKLMITGGGRLFDEYLIHMVEMAIVLLNDKIEKVRVEKVGEQRLCRAVSKNGSEANMFFAPPLPFSITGEDEQGNNKYRQIKSEFFFELICDILKFFEDGTHPFDNSETLEVMRLRSGLLEAEKLDGKWLEI